MKMVNIFPLVVLVFLVQINTINAATDPAAGAPADLVELVNNTFICKFADHVLPDRVPDFVNDIVQQTGAVARYTYTTAFRGFSAHMSLAAASALEQNNSNIAYCEQNALIKLGGAPVNAGKCR